MAGSELILDEQIDIKEFIESYVLAKDAGSRRKAQAALIILVSAPLFINVVSAGMLLPAAISMLSPIGMLYFLAPWFAFMALYLFSLRAPPPRRRMSLSNGGIWIFPEDTDKPATVPWVNLQSVAEFQTTKYQSYLQIHSSGATHLLPLNKLDHSLERIIHYFEKYLAASNLSLVEDYSKDRPDFKYWVVTNVAD